MKLNIKKLLAPTLVVLSLLLAPAGVFAATQSANTTINALIGSSISVTTSSAVNVSITPVSGGSQSSASDTVTVATNNAAGYALTLADSDATTTLEKGPDSIAAHAGTQAAPTVLANNSWGYRVDDVGGFGAGPTTALNNVTTSAQLFAGVPASGSPNTLKTTATVSAGDVTTVWYSVKADTSKPNGTYTDTVTYTATTNP